MTAVHKTSATAPEQAAGEHGTSSHATKSQTVDHARAVHERPQSIITATAAGVINFLLMFGLCSAYGMIMFEADHHQQHRALAVKMNLATAVVVGLLLSVTSKIKVAIGGPDLNPVVFLGGFISTMSGYLSDEIIEEYRETIDTGDDESCLAPVTTYTMDMLCDLDITPDPFFCDKYHRQLRATVIFTTAVSSMLFAVLFIGLGRLRLTRLVSYIPTSIMEAFLSCIGYKGFQVCPEVSKFKPQQFIPAACVGVPLYFLKARHIGNPAIVMPVGLLVPLGIFYFIMWAGDSSVEEMRDKNYMFPEMMDKGNEFYRIWTDSIGEYDSINYKAWVKTFPELAIMVIVCLIDCILKLSSTEAKLPVKAHKDFEIQLYGAGNVMTAMCGSSVGYMQLKFNVIAFGVMGNVEDRRGGVIYALLCAACFFGGVGLFNYLPRFFLSTLLFFAGAGFVAENLWGSRKYLSLMEWSEILIILAVFAFSGSLLYAVLAGGCLTGLTFIHRYSKIPAIASSPLTGKDVMTSFRRATVVQKNLQHIADSWLLVVKLKGYIFFGSAQSVTSFVRTRMEDDQNLPGYKRLRFVIFDCELLDGMDVSTAKALRMLVKDATQLGVRVMWTHVTTELVKELTRREVLLSDQDWFIDLEDGVCHVEEQIMVYLRKMQKMWLELNSSFRLNHRHICDRVNFEPFKEVFLIDSARIGCPWKYCNRMKITQFRSILWHDGEPCNTLFLVHTGAVGIFERRPQGKQGSGWSSAKATYRHGWFMNREALLHTPSQNYAVALEDGEVLTWTMEQWRLMARENPNMMVEMMKELMKQQSRDTFEGSKSASQRLIEMDQSDWYEFEHLHVTGPSLEETLKSETHEGRDSRWHLRFSVHTNVTNGEACQRQMSPSAVSRSSIACATPTTASKAMRNRHIPEELHYQLKQYKAAKGLGRLGFYEEFKDSEDLFLPELPQTIANDVDIAFATFAINSNNPEGPIVPAGKAAEALMYAGVYRSNLSEKNLGGLTRTGFKLLAQSCIMTPLNKLQQEKISEIFDVFDRNGNGILDVMELSGAFKKALHSGISADEVENIAHAWNLECADGQIDATAFTAIMSMYIRKHEPEWNMLMALQDVLSKYSTGNGGSAAAERSLLTANGLVKASPDLTLQQAEEMIWCVDWIGEGNTNGMDFPGLCAILTIHLDHPKGRLPPPPRGIDRKSSLNGKDDALPSQAHSVIPAVPTESDESSDSEQENLKEEDQELALSEALKALGEDLEERQRFYHGKTDGGLETQVSEHAWLDDAEKQRLAMAQNTCRGRLHLLLEVPSSSRAAKAVNFFTFAMIMCSVLTLFLEPLISEDSVDDENKGQCSETDECTWLGLEIFFTTIFTLELVLRFLVADALGTQTKCGFIRLPSNILDFVAVLPFYVEVVLHEVWSSLRLLRIFRIFRIFRLARLARFARLARLSSRMEITAPVSVVMVVIWGIYLHFRDEY